MQVESARKWLKLTALLSGIIWLIAWGIHLNQRNFLDEVELLFFFGVAVTTPLALRIALQPDRNGQIPLVYRAAIRFHPFAIMAVGIALLLEPNPLAGVLAGVWQVQTVLIALYGLRRLLARPALAIEELCIDAGLLYIPVSGIWFIAYCVGYPLFNFDRTFVLLTAVHFTFISPGALVIAGMMGRQLFAARVWRFYRVAAWFVVISPPLVAVGISATQFLGMLWLEAGSVLILASSFMMLALVNSSDRLPKRIAAKVLVLLSTTTLLITMSFALAYSLGRLTGWWSLSIVEMVQWHGWLNAVGFTFFGLLAWNMVSPEPNTAIPGIPFSRLPWRWHIGPNFFERIGAVELDASSRPTGIVARLQDYENKDFKSMSVVLPITAFYENTASHELLVYPEWQPYFHVLGRIYKQISKRLGQMNFPIRPETNETRVSSTIIPLREALDGRENVRGWIRVYSDTGQAVYVAAYSSHCHNNWRYMNIAFPLPFGSLTSILRLETPLENDGGVLLTSYSTRQGDQGVYFANRFLSIRLPINETIRVYPSNAIYEDYPAKFPIGDIVAEHKMKLFGLHFLSLHYSITKNRD